MAFTKEIYRALEEIVGSNHISDDPAVLETYTYSLSHTAIHMGPFFDVYTPRGAAVVLPASTQEVQAIVRLCNKYKLKFKASSTFWSAQGYPSEDDTLIIDMRRMDRIIEIDEKNMFAVVEPGVIGATLQAEAMQVGLNTHIAGCGCSCSPLASATSYLGSGPSNLYGGWHYENLLGAEWVMPNGDILRSGSLGSGCGWFCGDGPGPGTRGIFRGFLGAKGAMGVFTKCAIKLFAWPGPKTLPVEGTVPAYRTSLPENFKVYTLSFPSWQAWADAAFGIWEAGIGYLAHRQFNMFGRDLKFAMVKILTDPTKTLGDLEELLENPEVEKVTRESMRDFQIILAGMTMRDIAWQEKVLEKILEDTGGWKVAAMEDPEIRDWAMLYLIRLGHKNLNLVFGGGYDGAFGLLMPMDYGAARAEEAGALKKEWEQKGAMVVAGGDCMMGPIGGQGGGGTGLWENFTCFDCHDRASTEGTLEFFDACTAYSQKNGWLGTGMEKWNSAARGADGRTTPKAERDKMHLAAPQPSVFRYQRKIKEAFNPNDLGDDYFETLED
jgi:glycolate oxidase